MRTCPGHLILYLRKCVIQASSGTHEQPDGGEKHLLSNLRWLKTFVAIIVCVMSEWTYSAGYMQNTLPCVRRQDVMGSVRLTG